MRVVLKIGSSSLTDELGHIAEHAIVKLCDELAHARANGHELLVVSSGAVAAGMPAVGLTQRPRDPLTLQAISAVGQSRLMEVYNRALWSHGLVAGQGLISPHDFFDRTQYLHAKATLGRLLELGVVPVLNENDALADTELRFGDNDRIAALVAHLVGADVLVLLTDITGVFTSDPRLDASASLIEEIQEVDRALQAAAGGTGTSRGSGGMASKLAAARIAAWSGVRTVIAAASRADVVADAIEGRNGVGTIVAPRQRRMAARKLWIAFALGAEGTVVVDDGARRALEDRGTSLLPVGVVSVHGHFESGSAVEVASLDGTVFAKGLARVGAVDLAALAGKRGPAAVIHRDELVLVP